MSTTRPPNPLSGTEPWELVSAAYAEEATPLMRPFSERAIELAALGPDAVVLDVATGPGTLSTMIAPKVKRVHAVDFSPAMLEQQQRVLAERGLDNVELRVGDGQALDFDEGQFDGAFSMFGLMFFPDRPRGFRELFRVLKPGGVAVVSSWAPVDESSLMTLLFGAMRAAEPSRPAPQKDLLSLENSELFAQELAQAGFADVVIHSHVAELPASPADELWGAMTRSSAPLVLLRRRVGESDWARMEQAALAYLREQLAGGDPVLTTKAYLGFGRKRA
jgi:ubiquinone/menaquinone biosynthesis C-methylase UbiE